MGIPRRLRGLSPGKENLYHNRQSRPWDNDIARLKPPPPPPPQVSVSDRLRQFDTAPSTSSPVKPVPPPARQSNPLNAFLAPTSHSTSTPHSHSSNSQHSLTSSSSQHVPSAPTPPPPPPPPPPPLLNTLLGSREIKPLLIAPNSPPLVGLPIPPPPPPRPRSTSSKPIHESSSKAAQIASQVPLPPPPPLPDMAPSLDPPPHLSRRYSIRQPSTRHSVRHSIRISSSTVAPNPILHPQHGNLELLPDSSSFLDFNDDHRLNPLSHPQHRQPSTTNNTSFGDDPDSFDTFASIINHADPNVDPTALHHDVTPPPMPPPPSAPTPPTPPYDKPMFPKLSYSNVPIDNPLLTPSHTHSGHSDHDDEDGGLDIPARISASPAAGRAMRDLQRASITAANEMATSIRLMSQQPSSPQSFGGDRTPSTPLRGPSGLAGGEPNKLQGQLLLRSRIFRRWNLRYATVINQAYFGPVLLLFRPDSKPIFQASFSLKSSKMVALAHSTVTMHEAPRKHNHGAVYLFDVTTSQRTYTFACTDPMMREQWVTNLRSASPV